MQNQDICRNALRGGMLCDVLRDEKEWLLTFLCVLDK